MVAIVTGSDLGLERSSGFVLGSRGQIGPSSLGRSGENIHVNAATGNLVVGNRDEFLIGRGPDATISRTYNSLGLMNDDNGDNWRLSLQRRLHSWSATANTAGATVTKTGEDGNEIVYTYNVGRGAYFATDGSGAYDKIVNIGDWVWTDGDTQITETYDINGILISSVDTDGNGISYQYTWHNGVHRLSELMTADGSSTAFVWDGSNLSYLTTTYTDPQGATKTLTRTRYAYDGSNRLTTVAVDLSPEDNSVADGRTYVTNYTYHGSSRLIATIAQTDGSHVAIAYDGNRVASITQMVEAGVSRTTGFAYGTGYTLITDAQGNVTTLYYDGTGQLTRIDEPAAIAGGNQQIANFIYDSDGNLAYTSLSDGMANYNSGNRLKQIWYRYDANGNLNDSYEWMPPGYEVKRWTHGSKNEVLTETRFTTLDPDGHNGVDPAGAMTTRYVYDSENHLRFTIGAEGRVTQFNYDVVGNRTLEVNYTNSVYIGATATESDLDNWVGSLSDKSNIQRTDITYDFRGNVSTVTTYAKADASGNGLTGTGEYSRTSYIYDQFGNLLSKLANDGGKAETYAYDGLGRTIRFTDVKGIGTWTSYIDSQSRTITTLASGLTTTSVYNHAGELVSSIEARAGLTQEDAINSDINAWVTNASRTSAGMLDGSPATQISIATGQSYGYHYFSTPVEWGHALTWTISIMAVGASTSQALGIWANSSGWGSVNLSSARIISGPGSLSQSHVNGGYFDISNLSTTEATRIEVTRYFTQSEYGYPHLYTYGATGSPGESMIVAAQTITRSRFDTSAFDPAQLDINNWYNGGVGVAGAGAIGGGSPANQYIVSTTGQWSGIYTGIHAKAGDNYTASVSLKSVGGGTSASFGIHGNISQWGYFTNAISSARIISGPGILTQEIGGLWNIVGLSAIQETRIEITRTFQAEEPGGVYLYPNRPEGWIAGQGIIAGATSITKTAGTATTYKYDSLGRLRMKIDAIGAHSFYFYDKANRKIADVDQDGSVNEYKYDGSDRLIASIGYANAFSAAQVASLYDGYNPTTVEFATIRPAASSNDRWEWRIYDKADRLIQTIDAVGASVSYMYDGSGRLLKTTRYANAIAQATVESYKTNPPASLVQAPWDASVDRTTRNFYNNDGLLIGMLDEDNYLTEYVYDKVGRQIETIRYANVVPEAYRPTGAFDTAPAGTFAQVRASIAAHATDIHNYNIYDGRGLVVATIDGEGNVTRYHHNARGLVTQEVRGQQVTANTGYNMANLPAPSGMLDIIHFEYDALGQMTLQQNVLWGGNYENIYYAYDSVGNLIRQTAADTFSDANIRTTTNRYDAKGRLIATIGGNGSVALAALGASPTQAQIDDVYAIYGTRYVYDAADRLVQQITPDGIGVTGNRTLYYYDSDGQLRYEINALGEVTEYRYNVLEDRYLALAYGTRLSAATVSTLNGGLVIPSVTNAVNAIANAALDSQTQHAFDVRGNLFVEYSPLYPGNPVHTNYASYHYNSFNELVERYAYPSTDQTTGNLFGYNRRNLVSSKSQLLNGSSAGSATTTLGYDAFGRLAIEYTNNVDWAHWSQWHYDRANRVTKDWDAYYNYTGYGYDARSNLISQTDRTGKVTTFSYDQHNRTVTTTTAEGILSSVRKNAYGQTIQITDGAGRTTGYGYDKNGNLKTVTDAAGTTTKNYDNADRLIEVIDGRGVKTSYTYDAVGRVLTEIRDPGGINATTTYAYDAKGQQISITDARGSVSSFAYDLKGQKTRVVQDVGGLGIITDYQYRADGKVVRMTEAVGLASERRTDYAYDSMGRLTETRVDPNGLNLTTRNFYDVNDNIVATTDARGFTTRFVYDRENRQILSVSSQGEVVETGYDAEGRAVWTRSYVNRIVQATVDGFANEVTEASVRGSLTASSSDRIDRSMYDGDGRVAYRVDAEGYATRFIYDGANNLIKTIHYAVSITTSNSSTKASNDAYFDAYWGTVANPHPTSAVTGFTYDNANRLTSTTDAEGFTESYLYDATGNRTWVTNKLGGSTQFGYDNLGRLALETTLQSIHRSDGSLQASQSSISYIRDALGNVLHHVEAYGLEEQRSTSSIYDKLGRLITKTHATYQGSYTPVENFAYDARGNLILYTDPSGAKTFHYYDGNNRKVASVSAVSGSQATYQSWAYDGQGNVATERTWGTLVALSASPGGIPPSTPGGEYRETQFVYDRNGRLTERRIANIRTGAWNGSSYVSNAGQTLVVTSVYDAFGNMVQEIDANGTSAYHWYDRNGRAVQKLDASGYVTSWTRDEDGNVTSERRYATQFSGSPGAVSAPAHVNDRVTTFTYDKNGRRVTETRVGVYANVIHPTLGLLYPGSNDSTVTYVYNGLGEVASKTEANGDTTDYAYDNHGRLASQRDPGIVDHTGITAYHRTSFYYDGLGNLVRSTEQAVDAGGSYANGYSSADDRVTRYGYEAGKLRWMLDPTGFQPHYWYDSNGRRNHEEYYTRTNSAGAATAIQELKTKSFDLAGRVTEEWMWVQTTQGLSDAGPRTTYTYNAYGEVTTKSIGGVVQEQFQYDAAGRVIYSTAGDGTAKHFGYDGNGNVTAVIASAGADLAGLSFAAALSLVWQENVNATYTAYSKRNIVAQVIEEGRRLTAGGVLTDLVTSSADNAFGEITSETDARGYTTDYTYNALGRMIQKQSAAVSVTGESGVVSTVRPTENYAYDISGRLIATQDANGYWTTRLLLAGSGHEGGQAKVTAEYRPDGSIWSTGYDAFGDARRLTDGIGRITTQAFDKAGRVVAIARPATAAGILVESFSYDGLGQRLKAWNNVYGEANAARTDYDALGRVTSHVATGGDTTTTSYVWNGSIATGGVGTFGGWVETTTYANGRTSVTHSDSFGRELWKSDMGGHVSSMGYDAGGRMIWRNSGADSQSFATFNTGLLGSIGGTNGIAAYGYDAVGNRISEYATSASGAVITNATATYDALNRMTSWTEAGSATTPAASTVTAYDAVGNIRRTQASWHMLDQYGAVSAYSATGGDYWYRYDSLNRLVTDKGMLSGAAGAQGTIIVRGINNGNDGQAGRDIMYDAAGQRLSVATTFHYAGRWERVGDPNTLPSPDDEYVYIPGWWREQRENYTHDGMGHVTAVRNVAGAQVNESSEGAPSGPIPGAPATGGGLRSTLSYDLLGRLTFQEDSGWAQGSVFTGILHSRSIAYNVKGQVTSDDVSTVKARYGNNQYDTFRSVTAYDYGYGSAYALGNVVSQSAVAYKNGNNGNAPDTATTTSYAWWDGAVQASVSHDGDTGSGSNPVYTTTYNLNGFGQMVSANVNDGVAKTVAYTNDASGQIVRRDESRNSNPGQGAPHEVFYRFAGRSMGMTGNNGTGNSGFTQSVEERSAARPDPTAATAGLFRNGTNTGAAPYADFAQSYESYNTNAQGSAGGSYTVRAGDTLQSIAAGLYGDANLWYKIAEANGLTAQSSLSEGQGLTLPSGVTRNSHNASTFMPYDAIEAMGDTLPTTAKPPKKPKCGALGMIIMIAIAVAVTIATHGAAASFASSLGLGAGAAGGGALAAGTVGTIGATGIAVGSAAGIAGGVAAAVAGSVASQAFGLATGIQDKFSFKQVALAGISAGISGGIASAAGAAGTLGKVGTFLGKSNFASGFVRGALANGITQGLSVATGLQKSFSWTGVAVGGVVGGVSGALNGRFEGTAISRSIEDYAQQALTGSAAALAGAAARSLIDGTSFGDNIIAALPDVIGATVGNMLARGVSAPARTSGGGSSGDFVADGFRIGRADDATPRLGEFSTADLLKYNGIWDGARRSGGGISIIEPLLDLTMRTLGAIPKDSGMQMLTQPDAWNWSDIFDAPIVVNALRTVKGLVNAVLPNQNSDQIARSIMAPRSSSGSGQIFRLNLTAAPDPSGGYSMRSYTPSHLRDIKSSFLTSTNTGYQLRDSAYGDWESGQHQKAAVKYAGSLGLRALQAVQWGGFEIPISLARGHGFSPTPKDRHDAVPVSFAVGGLSAIAASRTVVRAAEGIGVRSLDATNLSFTQSSISFQKVGANHNLDTLVESMSTKGWMGNPIDVVSMPGGTLTTIDNTRVLAARMAGIDVQANVRGFGELITDPIRQRSLTVAGRVPETWGEAAQLRINKPIQNATYPHMDPSWSVRYPDGSIYDPVIRR